MKLRQRLHLLAEYQQERRRAEALACQHLLGEHRWPVAGCPMCEEALALASERRRAAR